MRIAPELIVTDKVLARFWSRVTFRTSFEDCWLWRGGKTHGYGVFKHRTWSFGAHRFSWMVCNDVNWLPKDVLVCHHCDVPQCVNPTHLFLGSNRDNLRDAARKGRLGIRNRGTLNGASKLTEDQVREIKRLRRDHGWGQRKIAQALGVPERATSGVIHGGSWGHVEL